ncbi:hypothetical protein Ahy_A09g045722 [Arachis hypogaea]|uniref:Uncharacterized protein n=1 Tax=Arachis hypogaea TaxID=3818 RepID=A0A445BN12_ARAHY|nr:hypothetical protein Ahy_A09g045722 [Arachis hypogaea]
MAAHWQQVEESHHDLVNLLTQQMTTILNPMMADHESRFERLPRQVEMIARIVDYDEGERHNARGNNEGMENSFQNKNNNPNRENPHVVPRVEIAIMGLEFYMRRKLLNVHIPDLAHLAEKVRQTKFMKKEKEKYRNEQRSKSKPFTRKEKVAYVTMESSEEEFNFEIEIDLAELKKGPLYVCSLLNKLSSNEKGLIQEAIMEGRLKFDDGKKEMKGDVDPFKVDASCVEPCLGVNMVGMSYDFDVALDDFESQVRSVYPRIGDGLLDFLVQQKMKDQNVSLCPRCNAVFDAEAAAIFEK